MLAKIRSLFAPPVFENDDDKTRAAYLLNTVILGLFPTMFALGVVATLFVFKAFELRSGLILFVCLALLGIYRLMRLGHVQPAAVLLILTLWGVFTVGMFRLGGVRVPAFTVYIVVTLLAGLLLGMRGGFAAAALSVFTGSGLFYAETSGHILYAAANFPPGAALSIHTVFLIIATILLYLYTRQVSRASEHSQRNERALIESNRQLQDEMAGRARIEAELRASEAHYRELFEASRDGVFLINLAGQYQDANPAVTSLVGYSPEELQQMTVDDLLMPDQGRSSPEERQRAWREGRTVEIALRHQDGHPVPVELSISPVGKEGEQRLVMGIARDISERKQAEEALGESEAKTRAILEVIPDLMFRLSADGEHLEFYAPSIDELYLDPEEFLGKRVDEVLPREIGEKYRYHIRKALQTYQMQVFEYQLDFPEGPRHYESRMVVSRESEILTIVRNITDRKRAGESLQQYTRRLEALREIDQAIRAARLPEEIARTALHHLRQLVPCHGAGVMLFDLEQGQARLLAVHINGKSEPALESQAPLEGIEDVIQSLKRGQAYQIKDLSAISQLPPLLQPLQAMGVRAFLGVPLMARNELVGSLNLGAQVPLAFTGEQVEIVREVAGPLAVAIRQARLHQQVQRHAEELERRVRERTAELRQMVNLMAGREVRMAELKEVIRQLRAQLAEAGLAPVADDPLLGGSR